MSWVVVGGAHGEGAVDGGTQVHVLEVKHTNATNIATLLREALPYLDDLGPVTITVDADSSSLIVEANDADVAALRAVVERLDQLPFQQGEPTLPRVVASALFTATGSAPRTVTVECHVVEGTQCVEVAAADATTTANRLPDELSTLIIFTLGYKRVEHGRRNGVSLRCERSGAGPDPTCSVDLGWGAGWQPVVISGFPGQP